LNRRFIRSIAILSGSNLAAQSINFVTYLILPRYFYSPGEFGMFGLFLAIYYILFEVVNLKMDQSIMLPDSETEARSLMGFSWVVAAVLSALFLAVIFSLNLSFRWMPLIMPALLGASLLVGGCMQPAMVFLNRNQAYGRMGNIRMIQALVTFAASIGAYYFLHDTVNGLVAGFIAGQVVAAGAAVWMVSPLNVPLASRQLVNRYSQFIRFGSLSAMISTLSRNLPAFVLKPVFGDAALGWYTLATKFLNAPVGIFSVSVAQVYFRDASRAGPAELRKLTRSVVVNILGLAVVPAAVFLLFGADIFEWVFGAEWREAGIIMQVLILWYYIAYASGPVSMLLDVKMKLDWELAYNTLLLIGRTAALLSAIWWKDVYAVLAFYAAIGIIFNIVLLNYILALAAKGDENNQ
jgi:O-antigen/teichoic acid export membrane protein